ncbi:MAG: aminopeptidase [Tissierellia bacterium]|nr:aminopeptidase [Tissierellia bacterium]
MKSFDQKLNDYAKLIVEIGINVQEGRPIALSAPVDSADFARKLVENAYKKGASDVSLNWYDDFVTRKKFEYSPIEEFKEFPEWAVERVRYNGERGAGTISVISNDPELLSGIDSEKIEAHNKSRSIALKDVMKYSMNDINSWCVAAIPSRAWAEKVFPDLKGGEAIDALWDAIFKATRIEEENPVEAWKNHLEDLKFRADYLNKNEFDKLIYKSSNGTDLRVGLPRGHIWMSGASVNSHGDKFVANMPTEEVFTAPDANRIDGVLKSTKPLAYGGNIIDKFTLEFKDGEVVDFSAEIGEEYLSDMLKVDENSKRLGEIALVPYDSPISNSNILFFNTLFDENASCHFAFGKAYPTCVRGGTEMDEEELLKNGINDSLIHVDFMVGSKDLSIIGVKKDGGEIEIFKEGNWAF